MADIRALSGLLCWCRPGFEPELAAELGERAGYAGRGGYPRAERDSGLVIVVEPDDQDSHGAAGELPVAVIVDEYLDKSGPERWPSQLLPRTISQGVSDE